MSDISKIKVNGVEYNVKDPVALRDAPIDGKQYARKNGAWSEVVSSGGSVDTLFNGKVMTVYGDSISDPTRTYTDKFWFEWVKEELQLSHINNHAVGGASFGGILYQINHAVDEYAPDIVVMLGGVNEIVQNATLGTLAGMESGTSYRGYRDICRALHTKYPTARIVAVTPTYQNNYTNSHGVVCADIAKAMREVSDIESIAVYDNYVMSEFCADNIDTFTVDHLHWNRLGHEMVGKNLTKWINNTFRYLYPQTPVTTYSVTNNLTHCSNSNGAASVISGNSYSATITASAGYQLDSVSCTMGGVAQTVSGGVISIASVTGNIVITATASVAPITAHTITNNLTNCTNSNSAVSINDGENYSATISANSGYTLNSVVCTMSGVEQSVVGGAINIASVTGDIIITATASAEPVEITFTPIANTCNVVYENSSVKLTNGTQKYTGWKVNANELTVSPTTSFSGNVWLGFIQQNGEPKVWRGLGHESPFTLENYAFKSDLTGTAAGGDGNRTVSDTVSWDSVTLTYDGTDGVFMVDDVVVARLANAGAIALVARTDTTSNTNTLNGVTVA